MRRFRIARALVPALLLCAGTATSSPPPARLFGQAPTEFAARRQAVRAAAGRAIVLLQGPKEDDDIERERFRTDSDMMYLTGVEAPGAVLALLPDGDPAGKREILFLPPRNPFDEGWTDPVPAPGAETARATGLESVQSARAMWETLRPSLEKARQVLLPGPAGTQAQYTPTGEMTARIKAIHPDIEIAGTAGRLIHALRRRKSPGEIANLRAAIYATGEAECDAARTIRPGAREIAVEGVILDAFRRNGAPREGFPCIVGSGPNSTVLHHLAGERRMQAGEMVVVDIGAEYNYYTADITRTFPCGGRFTPRQRQLYQLVLETQRACETYVRPGKTTLEELEQFARNFMYASALRARDADGNELAMDEFFPHRLGHMLGLDVHDVGGGSSVLDPGVVFTIEPGVYIPREGIGIRIEDDYLVTSTGVEKLSAGIPSDPAQIEALMAARPGASRGAKRR